MIVVDIYTIIIFYFANYTFLFVHWRSLADEQAQGWICKVVSNNEDLYSSLRNVIGLSDSEIDEVGIVNCEENLLPLMSYISSWVTVQPFSISATLWRVAHGWAEWISADSLQLTGYLPVSCGKERYLLQVIAPKYKSALFGKAGGR